MLDSINTALRDLLGPLGPLIAVGALGLVMILVTLPIMLKRQVDPLERIRLERQAAAAPPRQGRGLRQATGSQKLDRYADFLEPKDEGEYSATRLKLLRAGYRTSSAVRTFHFAQFALGLGFLMLGVIYAIFSSLTSEPGTTKLVLSALGPGLAGYYLPKYWVERRIQQRQEEITNGFPDALDMMLVCVEAGQSLDQSIIRVSTEIRAGFPALADEFEIVSYEMKAGKEKVAVLKDMAERAGVLDVSSFVTVLVQSATFGTSIADALRVYAAEMRDKRVMRAEEKANILPTKLTLGTMMFTVPPLLIILIGPSVYSMMNTLNAGN